MKKINRFSHLMPDEVGLTIKLSNDGRLNASMGFCLSEDISPDRADALLDLMYGALALIEDSPEMLLAYGAAIRPPNKQELHEVVFEPDYDLVKKDPELTEKLTNVIPFTSRRKQ